MELKLTPAVKAEYREWLGKIPDTYIARWIGVNRGTIGRWRTREGVGRFVPTVDQSLLGTMSDQALSEQSDCSYEFVRKMRISSGIEAYGHRILREKREKREGG